MKKDKIKIETDKQSPLVDNKDEKEVCILLSDCSPDGVKRMKDEYDVVDTESGIILFTGTGSVCKKMFPKYRNTN